MGKKTSKKTFKRRERLAGGPGNAQNGGSRNAQTNTSFIQQSQHDSKGSEGCDPSTQPPYHQEPSCESRSNDEGLQDVYFAVTGVTGAGKSTFIEELTGKKINIGLGLFSCPANVEEYAFVYDGRYKVHLVDTLGFDDTKRKDMNVSKEISSWLDEAHANDIKLSGIIYLQRINDVKMTETARKRKRDKRKMREKELLETEDFRGYMARNDSQIRPHMNTRESGMSIFGTLIENKLDIVLDIQKELGDEVRMDDTGGTQIVGAIKAA